MASIYIPKLIDKERTLLISDGLEGFWENGKAPFIPKLICTESQSNDFTSESCCIKISSTHKIFEQPSTTPSIAKKEVEAETPKPEVNNTTTVAPPQRAAPSTASATTNAAQPFDLGDYQDGRKVNQITYAVLAILFGGLGVHKFFAGKIGMGIVYLLFCWTFIPALIGLIEGIIALTKQTDSHGNISI